MEELKVTVYLSTYNQEEYVAQALDSILMQKTSFRYEIIAADDCSTDGTQNIILDYQKKYPGMIQTYFTNPNVGGCKKLTNCIDQGLFRGQYLAYLEGDDYWLGEDRLQTLVDFLDQHPAYSRVSHQRLIINEKCEHIGMDLPDADLNKPFTVDDFLAGKDYPDFASVFRNYFRDVGSKYHTLLLASRNVCDFQDMFITQDFGPVYVMDKCFAVYRSRSIAGATNYNSITTQRRRCIDHINICRAVEDFYCGKYDLSPMIERQQKRLLADAVAKQSESIFEEIRSYVPSAQLRKLAPQEMYLALRGRRKSEVVFLWSQLAKSEKRGFCLAFVCYAFSRIWGKLTKSVTNDMLRGYRNEPS